MTTTKHPNKSLFYITLSFIVEKFIQFPFVASKLKTKAVIRTTELYQSEGLTSLFAKIRFWDGPLHEVEKAIPKSGKVLDFGCGEGIATNYFAICQPKRKIVGIDLNKSRIKLADRGLKNTRFIYGDALKYKLNFSPDTIVLNNVMHHLPSFNSQEKLLTSCKSMLTKKGRLVIAEIDRGLSFRYLLGWFVDGIVVPVLFEGKLANFNFFHRPKNEWVKLLTNMGFKVKINPVLKGRPFPDIIMVAERRDDKSSKKN